MIQKIYYYDKIPSEECAFSMVDRQEPVDISQILIDLSFEPDKIDNESGEMAIERTDQERDEKERNKWDIKIIHFYL